MQAMLLNLMIVVVFLPSVCIAEDGTWARRSFESVMVDWGKINLGVPVARLPSSNLRLRGRSGGDCRVTNSAYLVRDGWQKAIDQMVSENEASTDLITRTVQRQFLKVKSNYAITSIGMFDSGVGGLTVYKQLRDRFPNLEVSYFADDQRAPYGPQPPRDVAQYSQQIISLLKDQEHTNMTLIACNTASIAAMNFNVTESELFVDYPILPVAPPYGLFFDALERPVSCRKVGIFATDATCASGVYQRQILSASGFTIQSNDVNTTEFHNQIDTKDCIGCAECVKAVQHEAPFDDHASWESLAEAMLRKKFASYLDDNGKPTINFLVYGCTHFPALEAIVRKIFGPSVILIDPAEYQVELVSRFMVEQTVGHTNAMVSGQEGSSKIKKFIDVADIIFTDFINTSVVPWNIINLSA